MPQISVNAAKVNYRTAGKGAPVILLHASSSHSGQWKPLMEVLAPRYRVLAPDLHGYGKSALLPRTDTPYFRQDADIAFAMLDEAGAPAHLVGHSLGGTIAARVALERPDALVSLTLIEPVLFNLLEERGDERRHEYLELAQAMMVLIRFGEPEKAARMFLDYWAGPGALDALDTATRDYVIRTIPRVSDDWYGISAHAPGALWTADLAGIRTPTLLLCGEKTRATTRGIAEVLCETIPGVEYREVPGAGHMSPVSHPDAVNELVAGFIAAQAGL